MAKYGDKIYKNPVDIKTQIYHPRDITRIPKPTQAVQRKQYYYLLGPTCYLFMECELHILRETSEKQLDRPITDYFA